MPKSVLPNGVRSSHARSNRKAVGGGVLTHAQLEAAEAGPSCEAQPPSFFPAPRVRKDAEAGGGPRGEASERGEAAARPHVEVAYHACVNPPSFLPSWEEVSCKS